MDQRKIIQMINMYLDGELNRGEETILFTRLAEHTEERKYLRLFSRIRSAAEESAEEFPEELEERILRSAGEHPHKKSGFLTQKISAIISYAAVLIMLVLSGYVLSQIKYYKDKVDDLSGRMERQNETIRMLYNSLPGIEVRAAAGDEIVIKPTL